MELPNGAFIGRDLADENVTWRKKVLGSCPTPDAEVTGESDAGAPGVMMSKRDKKRHVSEDR